MKHVYLSIAIFLSVLYIFKTRLCLFVLFN
jgi:hypothetical protein